MNARTRTLFHFTKTLDNLLCILKEGFWPRYCLEDITWLDCETQRLAWPMVSFCDIPISRLREHTDFYGDYGVGLCRERWTATGLNPLLYVSSDSILRDLLRELLLDVRKNPNPRIKTAAMVVLATCKPLTGVMEVKGTKREKDFYSECEWRFLPWVEEGKYGFFMREDQFRNEQLLKEANEERRKDRMLDFQPDDVRYLLVKTPEDVHKLVSFINTEMADYSPTALDVLKTRIIMLDDIACDL
jgi:hypothetical protein